MMTLTNKQMAGQRLMVGFDGIELSTDVKYLIKDLHVGGLILFKCNIEDPDQVRHLCLSCQEYAESCGEPALFIAVDQEGGTVARLKSPFTEFSGNAHMKGLEDAVTFARISARELRGVGINMNMAPVLDVAIDPRVSIMKDRAFGSDPDWVSRLGMAVIYHLQEGGVMSVAKHFPGIGRTTLDSHLDLPFLETNSEDLTAIDLAPFQEAIEKGVAGMMLSHICYRSLDDQGPASLSKTIVRDLLRHRMGYDGVVMTDDLDMGAIKKHHDVQTSMRRILAADIDIALICHRSPDIETAFETIRSFQTITPENNMACERSVRRILDLKGQYL
ncbi:MAG: beta-N-acetylhexosaminidase [Desulfobacterales bacterium]|nr:beta-N-acetylhexosaminidase [Desulfobacterales bacterium]MDX2510505.1 beta-N-acetylhexosaminidase [Desulfobacterales bacterium]